MINWAKDKIIFKLANACKRLAEFENFDRYEVSYAIYKPVKITDNIFVELDTYKDDIDIIVSLNDTPYTYQSIRNNKSELILKYNEYCNDFDEKDDFFTINIIITKRNNHNTINCYNSFIFSRYISNCNIKEFLFQLNNHLKDKLSINILYTNHELKLITDSIKTTNNIDILSEENISSSKKIDYSLKIKKLYKKEIFQNNALIPSDLWIVGNKNVPNKILSILKKGCLLLIFNILFDSLTIENNKYSLILRGYRTFYFEIEDSEFNFSSIRTYYDIYDWVFTGGNLIDKLGLAQNIISLNIDPQNPCNLPESTFDSLKSSFNVYEKQNIKQYIELRNKISDQLFSFNEKVNKVADDFANSFLKSALAMLSLFASIIISKVISNHNFKNLVSVYEAIIVSIFTMASFVYMGISNWDLRKQKMRFETIYNNLKERNKDLLDESDINRILNNDKDYKYSIKYISTKVKNYNLLWIALLLLILISTWLIALKFHPPVESSLGTQFKNV